MTALPGTFRSIVDKMFGIDTRTGALKWKNADTDGSQPVFHPLSISLGLRNAVRGGDFSTNPFQRGTSQASDIASTVTYGPDHWFFFGGASSAINWSQVSETGVNRTSKSLKFQRKATTTDTHAISMGQIFEALDCVRFQGRWVTLSFSAATGANYSGGNLTAQLIYQTSTEDTSANLATAGGNWATPTYVFNSTQALTSTMTRYSFTGLVPATATQLAILLTWTPSGTAGTNDFIKFALFQLEVGFEPGVMEHRTVAQELAAAQRYYWRISEPAAGVVVANGMISATNAETVAIPLPVQMRAAPTVSVTAGGFKFNIAGTATAVGGGFAGGSTNTPNMATVVGTVNATVGQATQLQGNGSTGLVEVSAEL